jgi:hypothetical protein
MHALFNPQASPPQRSAEIVSFAELNRARSHRALDRAADHGPVEAHPWAYCFPRTVALASRR